MATAWILLGLAAIVAASGAWSVIRSGRHHPAGDGTRSRVFRRGGRPGTRGESDFLNFGGE